MKREVKKGQGKINKKRKNEDQEEKRWMMLILTEWGGLGEEGQDESESGEPVLVS